jgi:hypothetical protein
MPKYFNHSEELRRKDDWRIANDDNSTWEEIRRNSEIISAPLRFEDFVDIYGEGMIDQAYDWYDDWRIALEEISRNSEIISAPLRLCEDFVDIYGEGMIDQAYDWYSKAMNRRERKEMEYDYFVYHFFKGGSYKPTCFYGNSSRGFILGTVEDKNEVFAISHFAPKSLRKGYELMKELGASQDIPAIMFVTDDLVKTINKMPEWNITQIQFPMFFRGGMVMKTVVYNSYPGLGNMVKEKADKYLSENDDSEEDISYSDDYDEELPLAA